MRKGRKSWLSKELEELERTDPAVAEAARRIYDPVDGTLASIERTERHLAARKAVGKRAMPKEATVVLAAALAALAIGVSGTAKADPDDPGPDPAVVGGMYDAGVPPSEIPHRLLENQPRLNSPTLPYQVFRDLQDR